MLSREEKYILRILFQNKIHKADGQAFEDIFTSIMNYCEPNFRSIKPWGRIGDRKNDGYIQVHSLEHYLANNSNFLADELRDKLNDIYIDEKANFSGDELFWNIVDKASPRNEQIYQTAVIVIMSKYFESCDIFEEPGKEEK